MRWGGATDVGQVRSDNQDQLPSPPTRDLWAVADGMGGHSGGEVASRMAIADPPGPHVHRAHRRGPRRRHRASQPAVFGRGRQPRTPGHGHHRGGTRRRPGPRRARCSAIASVGDSRCSLRREGELDQAHHRPQPGGRPGARGPPIARGAAVHPSATSSPGCSASTKACPSTCSPVDPLHGDRYVLCSDGLFNEVPSRPIAAVLRRLADPPRPPPSWCGWPVEVAAATT